MTDFIKIDVEGTELESITIELSKEEVAAMYKQRKELTAKVVELQKEVDSVKSNKKYTEDRNAELSNELSEANTLLTALGVQEKTNEEESYYRKQLKIATRIALYIANSK